jgi:hypothetical protein
MFRGSVKSTGYLLHSPVFPSLPLPCVTVCHHISTGVCIWTAVRLSPVTLSALLQFSYLSWTFKLPSLSIFDEVHLTDKQNVHKHCFPEHLACAAYSVMKLTTATNSQWCLRGLHADNTTAVYVLKSGLQVYQNSKRIPSIFNDESTGSFICFRRHVKMISIPAIRVTCMKDFCIGCKNTAESFLFLFTVSLHHPPQPALHAPHRIALIIIISLPPTPSCNKRNTTHTYSYVTCSKVNAEKQSNEFWRHDLTLGAVRNVIR